MYFIIGASSFIGKHLYDHCKEQDINVLGTYYNHPYYKEWLRFDICNDNLYEIVSGHLDTNESHAVIICAANTSIDGCKADEICSNNLNVTGIKRLIGQADKMGIKSVFLSSETVFDGKKGKYTEEDVPNPITLYGKQKLLIEQYIAENANDYLIFRISRAVGSAYGEKDIFNEFYNKIVHNEPIVCLRDQRFCITEINDITQVIIKALGYKMNGLYHLSSENYISRYELAELYVKKIFGRYENIVEKEYSDIHFLDKRHIFGGLTGRKLTDMLGIRYMSTDEIINKYKNTYDRARRNESVSKIT